MPHGFGSSHLSLPAAPRRTSTVKTTCRRRTILRRNKMFRIIIAALAFLAATAPALASRCAGVDLAVGSVAAKSVSTSGNLNRYDITGTVTNVGSSSQGANALQSVDIYDGNQKLDSKSIPPLKVGQSFMFSYVSMRSSDAGKGTTSLRFQLNIRQPSTADAQTCNMSNDSFTLTF
jgi:hypothetical protein